MYLVGLCASIILSLLYPRRDSETADRRVRGSHAFLFLLPFAKGAHTQLDIFAWTCAATVVYTCICNLYLSVLYQSISLWGFENRNNSGRSLIQRHRSARYIESQLTVAALTGCPFEEWIPGEASCCLSTSLSKFSSTGRSKSFSQVLANFHHHQYHQHRSFSHPPPSRLPSTAIGSGSFYQICLVRPRGISVEKEAPAILKILRFGRNRTEGAWKGLRPGSPL
ncbi:hypothetical protein F5Y18DRAFT_32973 [Xylariaceae sp. FL1019]|nr:hypothetical protein F5Y18DRAFT_32973 [Xylariaceae sp. FL1019]